MAQLRARHYYTDTATFDLRCGVCGTGLRGENGARDHAMQTGRECLSSSPRINEILSRSIHPDVEFGEY